MHLTIAGEISSKPGLLLAFQLLNTLNREEGIHLNLYLQKLKNL